MSDDAPTDAAPTIADSAPHGGRFQPGNKYGKGNPLAKRQAAYRAAFAKAVDDDTMEAIARAACEAAMDGDVAAMRFVAEYTMGKPAMFAEDGDGDDGRPIAGRIEVRFVPAVPTSAAAAPESGVG